MVRLKQLIKHWCTVHRQGPEKNLFIFSTARSGTTWLAELLASQGRFKIVNEPFNLRSAVVRDHLGVEAWKDLLRPEMRPEMRRYLQSFVDGTDRDLRFKRETPGSEFWHPRTDRVLFKILFAGEDSISWFRDQFNAEVLLLLRHPIAVSLSRKELPRLHSFLEQPYAAHFSAEQLAYAEKVVRAGDPFEMAVLDWCLQNAVPLRDRENDWIVLSYEELAVDPDGVIGHLAQRLRLPRPAAMLERVFVASRSTGKSSEESRKLLLDPRRLRANRMQLIERWKERVSEDQEKRAFEALAVFGIDFYTSARSLPADRYLLSSARDRQPAESAQSDDSRRPHPTGSRAAATKAES